MKRQTESRGNRAAHRQLGNGFPAAEVIAVASRFVPQD
jgi:hypothetical protein